MTYLTITWLEMQNASYSTPCFNSSHIVVHRACYTIVLGCCILLFLYKKCTCEQGETNILLKMGPFLNNSLGLKSNHTRKSCKVIWGLLRCFTASCKTLGEIKRTLWLWLLLQEHKNTSGAVAEWHYQPYYQPIGVQCKLWHCVAALSFSDENICSSVSFQVQKLASFRHLLHHTYHLYFYQKFLCMCSSMCTYIV